METTLEDRVRDTVASQLGVGFEQVTMDAKFVDDLGADSLDTVELLMAFEEAFGVQIPEADAVDLTCAHKVIEYLKAHGYGAAV